MKYFSASTRGFYDQAIHGARMPSDVVGLTDEEWSALLDAQLAGKEIVPAADGRPIARARVLSAQDRATQAYRQSEQLVRDYSEELAAGLPTALTTKQHHELVVWRHAHRNGGTAPPPTWLKLS